jgi:hypothetical protein
MKNLLLIILVFTTLSNSHAQMERISLKDSSFWFADGEIHQISKSFVKFNADSSSNNSIIFKNQSGKTLSFPSKKDSLGLFTFKKDQISIEATPNDFKTYLIQHGAEFDLLQDRTDYIELSLLKFRKLQLTSKWVTLFGGLLTTIGVVGTTRNSSIIPNSDLFIYSGAALSGLGFVIGFNSLSKLKFQKKFKRFDPTSKTYIFK